MKRTICCILALFMLLSILPVFAFAEENLPTVTIEADKTEVKKGDTVTLTMKLNKDVAGKVALWQWNFVWDSSYFKPVSAKVGNAAQSGVTPIVNYQNPTTQMAEPYACATVTSGNAVTSHELKAGVIATLTLTAKRDVFADSTARFFIDDVIVADSEGTPLKVTASNSAVEWGNDHNKIPGTSAGLKITVKPLQEGTTGIILDDSDLAMKVGEDKKLGISISDNLVGKAITWTSSDEAVVTVADGKITAVAAGTATITAKIGEYTATCVVTVTEDLAPAPSDPADPTLGENSDGAAPDTKPNEGSDSDKSKGGIIWIVIGVVAVIAAAAGVALWLMKNKKKEE